MKERQILEIVRFTCTQWFWKIEDLLILEIDGPVLVYLNVICGIALIIMTQIRFSSYVQTALLLIFVVASMIVGSILERRELYSVQTHQISKSNQEKRANRILYSILLVFNIIAFLVLWLFIPFPAGQLLIITFVGSVFLIILYFDFSLIGRELARSRVKPSESESMSI
ncbi:MAG: hypothetical protein ACFFEV_06960 [Candidatus Thorarchaeota archaeon]